MEPGFSSYALGWAFDPALGEPLSPDGLLDHCVRLGYRRLQVADNCDLRALPIPDLLGFVARAAQAGVQLELGARLLEAKRLPAYLSLARTCGSPFLRFVIDGPGYEPTLEEVEFLLRAALPVIQEAGVILAIENHDRFPATHLRELLDELDSPWLGICLDTANSLGAGEGITEVVVALGKHAVNLHLKDIRVRRVPSMQGFTVEGTPLGHGQIPLEWVIAEVARLSQGRCRSATLEHWVPPVENDPAATRAREMEWCEISTATMRRLFPSG
jgi:sugar phosphate isomerase/epimerase